MTNSNATRTYIVRTSLFMAGYIAVNVLAIFGAFDDAVGPALWGISLAAAAPVAGQIWATIAYINDADEFVSQLTARRFIVAAGFAIAVATGWGFAETYANATHLPPWLIYPTFWAIFGVISPLIRSTTR